MQVGQFPASAANSLIEGYCDDFVSLAAVLAQTLEQISMRGINFSSSRGSLERIEAGMRQLADAIQDLLQRQPAPPAATPPMAATATPTVRPLSKSTNNPNTNPMGSPPSGHTPSGHAPSGQTASGQARPAFRGAEPAIRPAPPSPAAAPGSPLSFDTPAPQTSGLRPSAPPPPPPHAQPPARTAGTRELAKSAIPPLSSRLGQPNLPPGKAPPEALKGTNESMPVRSVFQFLGRMRKSGIITIHTDHEALTFEFQNGCVVSTTSSQGALNERLGELMIELGFCQRAVVEKVLLSESQDRLGHALVQQRLATNGQVLEALELQVRRRFARACACKTASYEFLEGARQVDDDRIRIAPMELTFMSKT